MNATSVTPQFDPGSEMHAPELYQPTGVGYGVETFDDITEKDIQFYNDNGYLMVRQAFTPAEVKDAVEGITALVMGSRPDFKNIWFEAQAREQLETLTVDQRLDAVRKLATFGDFEPRLRAIALHQKMLAQITRLMGGAKPDLFQEMALIKPPRLGREKPWHQDQAYFDYPLGTPVVGVWIALDEATILNGCMQFLPGEHKNGPRIHFQKRDWQICDTQMMGSQSVAAPLKPGGLLFFSGLLPHGTPHNSSPSRRRALQFHYAPAGVVKAPSQERLDHFGADGKNVTC